MDKINVLMNMMGHQPQDAGPAGAENRFIRSATPTSALLHAFFMGRWIVTSVPFPTSLSIWISPL